MKVETERETDGRWIAEVPAISGALAYGESQQEAVANVDALVLEIEEERRDWFHIERMREEGIGGRIMP